MRSRYLVLSVIALICNYCSPLCNNTFENTLAVVSFDGNVYLREYVNGCLENRPLKTVILEGSLRVLYQHSILNMLELEDLYVDGTGLRHLYRNFIIDVPKLRRISINLNPLSELRENQFSNFALTTLDLSRNRIERIGRSAFSDIKLKSLDLSNNRLVSINREAFKDSKISILHLQYNNIVRLSKNVFDEIHGTEEIHLNNNNIYYIEDMTFKWLGATGVAYLNLRANALTQINFLSDTTLRHLDIGLNHISYLFLKNSTRIQAMRICPNPWHCKCLRDFWKFAEMHRIKIQENTIQYDVGPICIAQTPECKENYNYDKLREMYFQEFSYEKYWKSITG